MFRLYGYWRDTATWRVRLALALKRIPYERVSVDIVSRGGAHRAPEFRVINPAQQVPVLAWEEDGREQLLTQSLAIISYLEGRFPSVPLIPSGFRARSRAWELAEIVNADIAPLHNLGLVQRLARHHRVEPREWTRQVLADGLSLLETHLALDSHRFAVGDAPTIADICIIPALYEAEHAGIDLERYPRLRRISRECARIPAFRSAHAENQPDAAAATF